MDRMSQFLDVFVWVRVTVLFKKGYGSRAEGSRLRTLHYYSLHSLHGLSGMGKLVPHG